MLYAQYAPQRKEPMTITFTVIERIPAAGKREHPALRRTLVAASGKGRLQRSC